MKNVFKVFCEVYQEDKKEFFGTIAFVIAWLVVTFCLLTAASI